jgi:methionine-rich copper-binding protein CopC
MDCSRPPAGKGEILVKRVILVALAATMAATSAAAHPRLRKAAPERGEALARPPSEIRVTFSEPVSAAKSTFTLSAADGKPVPTGKLAGAKGDKATLVLPIGARLKPGTYSVRWTVASEEHSSVPGSYNFDVKR